VLASIPLDVLQAESDRPADSRPADGVRLPVPAAADIEEAAALLDGASRPVIVLGGGVLRPRWSEEIVALAGQLTAPVVTTWMRKNAFPNSHPLFAGALGYGSAPSADAAVAEADVLLALGCRFSEFTTQRWSLVSEETRIIQVDVDPHEIGAIYPPAVGLVGDGWATAGLLAEAVGGRPADALRDQRAARAAELRARYEGDRPLPPPGAGSGVASAHVVEALDAALRQRELILVQDAHSFGPWVSRHLEFDRPGSYHGAAGGSMGWGLPAALGVQLARPDARVVAVCGDGSFWMVAQELETAVREELPVVVVVTNNFSYGNTRDRQRIAHEARYHGVFYDNPDFAAFARLLGGHGERVERGEDLEAALARALDSGRPAVVDVIQDRHEGLPPDLAPPAAQ
jgi:acetolactate synthase-1/2/3 large subunit